MFAFKLICAFATPKQAVYASGSVGIIRSRSQAETNVQGTEQKKKKCYAFNLQEAHNSKFSTTKECVL